MGGSENMAQKPLFKKISAKIFVFVGIECKLRSIKI